MSGGTGSCLKDGLLAALAFAEGSAAKKKIIFYVGTGAGHCGGLEETSYLKSALDVVTSRNAGGAEIRTIGVKVAGEANEAFLRDLAAKNGGAYIRVEL